MPIKRLYASGEDYLEATLMLQKKIGSVRSVDLARHLAVSIWARRLRNKSTKSTSSSPLN